MADKARAEAEREGEAKRSAEEQRLAQEAARAKADAARDRFNVAFKTLDARATARWATAPFAETRDVGAHAAQRYAVGDYLSAAEHWDAASAKLAELEKALPDALAAATKRGQDALAAGKTGAAREAFELALAIQPNHPPATAGIARAGRLDQALALVDAARGEEQAGRASAAEAGYRKALSVDSGVPGAQEGLNRLAAIRSADAYSVAMSRGFADAAAGRNDEARAAFNQALALRPGAREAKDALAALEQGQKASALELLEARARDAPRRAAATHRRADLTSREALGSGRARGGAHPHRDCRLRGQPARAARGLRERARPPRESSRVAGATPPRVRRAHPGRDLPRRAVRRVFDTRRGAAAGTLHRGRHSGRLPRRAPRSRAATGRAAVAGDREMRGADLKDLWLEDPLGERKLLPSDLPLSVGGPGASVVIPGCRPGELRARVALTTQGLAVTP